ncbi:hypothetical protein SD37_36610 [Amycolatopsis orientalis]|uniref:DUF1707 domain-containing protein n=1 Tax=Amycolatopsis orientalis TaxID=31958 RepID=A0A193C7W5_AMYOR|nr:DUF1707 domain-containing protein [Amycolatopsis orientalis]ANN20572.1 hypothetical protein SD37_36610 [Amycolatopsis orientalis]
MSEVPSPQLRISDQDRESALTALGDHLSVGRIDIDEFGERSAQVTAAKTRGELSGLFADLPEPHPLYDRPMPVVGEPAKPASKWAEISTAQRVLGALLPILFIATIALIVTTDVTWWFILVPIGISAVGEGIWGKGWDSGPKKLAKQRRRELDG